MVVIALSLVPATSAAATLGEPQFETCLLDAVNGARSAAGVTQLAMAVELVQDVRAFSAKMASEGALRHMTSVERDPILPDGWSAWGENVAYWSSTSLDSCSGIHQMLMNSSGHRANILGSRFRYAAIGVHIGHGGTWVTELFFDASNYSPSGDGRFWDDDQSVFEAAIEKLAAASITEGCNPPQNDRFCPEDHVSRGQMAAFLSRAFGLVDRGDVDFVDDGGSIFEASIEKLATAGITSGCNPPANDRFCPDRSVTRGEMAAFLSRALGLVDRGDVDFVDDDGSVFEASIEKLAAAGITLGCNPPANDRFCPNDFVTRGQMAAFLVRALDL